MNAAKTTPPTPPADAELFELARLLSKQVDFDEVLRLIAQRISTMFRTHSAHVLMINPQTRQTVRSVVREGAASSGRKYQALQAQISGWMIKYRQPFRSEDLRKEPRLSRMNFDGLAFNSVIAESLRSEDTVIGSLMITRAVETPPFSTPDVIQFRKVALLVAPYLRQTQKIQHYFEPPPQSASLRRKYEAAGLLGSSKAHHELLQTIEAAARCDVRVILEGDSGTGKELVARAIHKFSERSDKPFVAIDCGAIPASLIESELFGHTKGAFTGANSDRAGVLEQADGGTLFMDEIANLPLEMQSKFLRVLQEGEFRPLGASAAREVNVRIISASSRPLQQMIAEQQFREDLYYRLYVYPVQVPKLNERADDIPLLANHFLQKFAGQQEKRALQFSARVLDALQFQTWPGNIRELENFVERIVATLPESAGTVDHDRLPPEIRTELKRHGRARQDDAVTSSLPEQLAEHEYRILRQALGDADWNQSAAARTLKIPVQTLRYRMKKLGIEPPK